MLPTWKISRPFFVVDVFPDPSYPPGQSASHWARFLASVRVVNEEAATMRETGAGVSWTGA
ncbi:MAG: hypothetical protein CM1200mP18_07580 [Gammaproteobacteria bacterium]|nr:MAG: hypothetical protein CM1200mP18_07580 [Gammaproteobacteria bacterium]